jgi:hypothetical protein
MKKQLIQRAGLVGSTLALALSHAASVHAQSRDVPALNVDLGAAKGTFGFDTLGQAISTIITVIFFVAGLAAFFFILWGAVSYVTAGDDSSKTEAARKRITNAVVGLILVALVYVIWLIVSQIVGIDTLFGGAAGVTS